MMELISSFSGFSVIDIREAKDFYEEILGLEAEDETMGHVLGFKLPGGGRVVLYEKTDHKPAEFTVLNFLVEDINDAVDRLVEKGIEFEVYDNLPASQDGRGILRGKSVHMGPDVAWFKDPSGNILSILEN